LSLICLKRGEKGVKLLTWERGVACDRTVLGSATCQYQQLTYSAGEVAGFFLSPSLSCGPIGDVAQWHHGTKANQHSKDASPPRCVKWPDLGHKYPRVFDFFLHIHIFLFCYRKYKFYGETPEDNKIA
jgi:hypothetical protein